MRPVISSFPPPTTSRHRRALVVAATSSLATPYELTKAMSECDASLPTPPRVRRRDKENQQPSSSPVKKGIEWAENEMHYFSPESGSRDVRTPSSSRILPSKSILKPPRPLLPIPFQKQRDITPAPQDGLANANYLAWPVSTITDATSSLRDLTEAYSILTARIREAVPPEFFLNRETKKHPLFQPLRQNAKILGACIVRDLGRVFEDPLSVPTSSTSGTARRRSVVKSGLPSPRETPSPKKGGMTEDQVKCARDLSTTAIAVSRFLALALSTPNVYSAFSDNTLSEILDAVLAIPLADSLRSSSSRKIYGLAMTVLQAQRLPSSILDAAKERIVYAIRRGILGEFGREGKKGAMAESLKAIHDLCVDQPLVFVPVFTDILSCILDVLLNPTPSIRIQAANALGGFVRGLTESSLYPELFDEISSTVVDFFLRREPSVNGPSSTIQRTLQATLRVSNPTHHAQGPYWAVCVLASIIVLLGPAMFTNFDVVKDLHVLLKISFFADKKMVRVFTQTLWSPLVWVWRKYHDYTPEESPVSQSELKRATEYFEKILVLPACEPIGVVLLCALMGRQDVECPSEDVAFTLLTLRQAVKHGGDSTQRSLEVLDRLVNGTDAKPAYDEQWDADFDARLLCKDLFSSAPGILTSEQDELAKLIEKTITRQPSLDDLRPFSDEEKRQPATWNRTREIWFLMLEQVQMGEADTLPELMQDIWVGLLRSKAQASKEKERTTVSECCAETLINILANPKIDLRWDPNTSKDRAGPRSASALFLKLRLVRFLWSVSCGALSNEVMRYAIKPMIRYLVSNFSRLVPSDDKNNTTLSQWAELVAQVATVGPDDTARVLWTTEWDWDERTRAHVWRSFARGWTEDQRGSWKGAAMILGLPFENDLHWNMSDADLSEWNSLLQYSLTKADKLRIHRWKALDVISSYIDHQHVMTLSSSMRVADFLLSALNYSLENSKVLPISLLDFVHEVFQTTYPPEPRNKIISLWALRSLLTSVNDCPTGLLPRVLEILHDGIIPWLVDECEVFSKEEYSGDVVPLYQTILVSLQALPPCARVLQDLSGLLLSALKSSDNTEAVTTFREFWQISCTMIPEPDEGWDDSLKHALCIAKCATVELQESTIDDKDELDVLPRSASRRRHGTDVKSELPFVNTNTDPSLTLTPKRSAIPLPTRRRRSMGVARPVPRSPESPTRRKTRKSIAHVMELEDSYTDNNDKENISPKIERNSLALGKRKALLETHLGKGKKRRMLESTDEHNSDCDADIEAVEAALQINTEESDDPPPAVSVQPIPHVPVLSSNISRLNVAELGSRHHPIILDPPSPPKRRRTSHADGVPSRLRAAKLPRYAYQISDQTSSDTSEDSSSPAGPATPVSHDQRGGDSCRVVGSDSDDSPMDESPLAFSPTRDALSRSKRPKVHVSKVMSMRPKAIPKPKHILGAPFTLST